VFHIYKTYKLNSRHLCELKSV